MKNVLKLKDKLSSEKRTMIFYESPHKLIKTLTDFLKTFGPERQASVTKEISKVFESTVRGNLKEVLNQNEETVFNAEARKRRLDLLKNKDL